MIARDGISGLTHRSAASEAGVPLGLTTYYFSDKGELARSSLEYARGQYLARDAARIAELVDEFGIVTGLAHYVAELTGSGRGRLIQEYRVYLSALYVPALRDAVTWPEDRVFDGRTDPRSAAAFHVIIEGVLLRAVMLDIAVSVEEVEALLRPHCSDDSSRG
ncbi:TetR family transcriptional regulator [Leifsonia kafniensis]|uniref:TetR family transcriptional regulator n=1 Tax=Leifsonia kafniensis TaxID=475957 RepID=A0ABP7KLZ2_9MICO